MNDKFDYEKPIYLLKAQFLQNLNQNKDFIYWAVIV